MDVQAAFIGRTTLDVLYVLDNLPTEDTKVFSREFHTAPGGPACNAAITCVRLGATATLITAIGTDPWPNAVRQHLASRHISLIDIAEGTGYETPLTTILINKTSATRTIINPPQARQEFHTLHAWRKDWGTPPGIVLTDGFHLRETLPLVCALRDAGAAVCLDGGSWKPGTEELAPLLTVAICSERFAVPGLSVDPETTLNWFAAQGVPHAAVTRGPRPILGLDRGRRFEIAIPPIEAVDTSGAGDVLHGAFCFHFAGSKNFEQSLRAASTIASCSCQSLGTESWTPTSPK
jgi:sugar/nucleoside kinase (ribokinase family)